MSLHLIETAGLQNIQGFLRITVDNRIATLKILKEELNMRLGRFSLNSESSKSEDLGEEKTLTVT
jgi:hypothetical protein